MQKQVEILKRGSLGRGVNGSNRSRMTKERTGCGPRAHIWFWRGENRG
jgi:hypothetical protein